MGYLFLATVFYTVVKFSVDVWLQLRYERDDAERNHEHGYEIGELKKKVAELEKEI